jgi:putative MATE family efflux protein
MSEKTIGNDFTRGNITRQLTSFATPFMISNALQAVYSMVDMLVVGNVVGETGLSAVNNASMLIMLMTTLCMGFSNSGQVYISQLMGAHKHREINYAIGTLFTTIMIMAAVMTVVSVTLCNPLLRLMDVQGGAFGEARDYMLICGGGIAFSYGYNMVSAVLRGMGESKMPLLFIAIASVVNIVLDIIFVRYLGWSVAGAAWATIIGQAVSFIVSVVYLFRRREAFGFDFRLDSYKIRGGILKVLVRLGIPFAIQMSAINISMLFVNRLINTYGGLSCSAAFGVNCKIAQIPDIISRSIGMASGSMIGQNLAANEIDRAKKIVHTGLWMCAVIYAVFAVAVLGFPQQLFGLFTSEANVLKYAWPSLICTAISFPAHMLMTPSNAFVQGIGDAKFSLFIALMDGVVARISLSYILGVVLGESLFGAVLGMGELGPAFGFFLGYNLATYVTAIPSTVYFFAERWRKRELLV